MREWLILEAGTTLEQAEQLDRALLSLTPWATAGTVRLCGTRQALDGRILLYVPPNLLPVRADATAGEIDAVVALLDTHVTAQTRQDQRTILDVARGNRRPLRALLAAEIRRAAYGEDVLMRAGLIPDSDDLL